MPEESRAWAGQLMPSVDRWESTMRDVSWAWRNKREDTFLPTIDRWKGKHSAWPMNKSMDRRRDEEPTKSDENLKKISRATSETIDSSYWTSLVAVARC